MLLLVATAAQLVKAHAVECGIGAEPERVKCMVMPKCHVLLYLPDADAAYARYGSGEVAVYQLFGETYRLKYTC